MSDPLSPFQTKPVEIAAFPSESSEASIVRDLFVDAFDHSAGEATLKKFLELPVSERRYKFGAWIADGGIGKLYVAEDTVLGREVAIKVLRHEFSEDERSLLRLLQEARIHSQFHHRSIPPLHDVGRFADGRAFLAMKHIRARTLTDVLLEKSKENRRLDCLPVFGQVCEAIDYAHCKGVIHRDLTPNNILVSAKGRVHVIDWGLAKVLETQPKPDDLGAQDLESDTSQMVALNLSQTGEGIALGTPAFMAPEKALGSADDSVLIDVFGLGGILCYILTGAAPFEGKLSTVMRSTRSSDMAPAFTRLDRCRAPKPLISLAKACLSPDLKLRPKSVAAITEELAKAQASAGASHRSWWGRLLGG